MNGIFGVLDRHGIQKAEVLSACEAVSDLPAPTVFVDRPDVVLGLFGAIADECEAVTGADSSLVVDARLDGWVGAPPPPSNGSLSTGQAIKAVLDSRGPEGLGDLAADFALAYFDHRAMSITLSKDAFAVRPLYWAKRGPRFAFASDPWVLLNLGLGSRELDREVVASYLRMQDYGGERTGFTGISRVLGGRWITCDTEGRVSDGRWFRPESIRPSSRRRDFVEETREAVVAACRSRAHDRPVSLLLSGGRDSASVAVALQLAGIKTTCLTQSFDEALGCSEQDSAQSLAEQLGHKWVSFSGSTNVDEKMIQRIPVASREPLGPQSFPQMFAWRDAVGATDLPTILDGMGGEPLFSAAPVSVAELLVRGHPGKAVDAARNFHRQWTYSYGIQLKAAARAVLPRSAIRWRERQRRRPPWVLGPGLPPAQTLVTAPRSARDHLIKSLVDFGRHPFMENFWRNFASAGAHYASPLLDQRVVGLCMAMPTEIRAPVPTPKPALDAAFLREIQGRRKVRFASYFEELAKSAWNSLLSLDKRLLAVREGLVARDVESYACGPWTISLLPLISVEAWLRYG